MTVKTKEPLKKKKKQHKGIEIRKLEEKDMARVAPMFEDFQDFLASIDTLKRLKRKNILIDADYGYVYLRDTLKKIVKQNGVFYVAEHKGKIVGFVVGLITELNKTEKIEVGNKKIGEVAELYIEKLYWGTGLAKKLMTRIEKYFRDKGCTDSILDVFEPNIRAREFYKRKVGYVDRRISMLKELK